MLSRISIAAAMLLAAAHADAALRFSAPVWRPDMGIAAPSLAGASAEPVELPRAESYMVTEPDGSRRMEDRFDTFDLWTAATVRGRWRDASGNRLLIARLSHRPPADAPDTILTRSAAETRLRPLDPEDRAQCAEAARAVAPHDLDAPVRPRRSQRHALSGLFYLPCTNSSVFAYLFRPRTSSRLERADWYLAVLESSDPEAAVRFDQDFLDNVGIPAYKPRVDSSKGDDYAPPPGLGRETTLLLRDLRRSVANYDDWHFAAAGDVAVMDDLPSPSRETFLSSLTNDLPRYRREYAARVPSAVAATNTLAAVRVFATRGEYLAYVGAEHKWSAALWDTLHRELVLYLPESGADRLLHTVWHEAFHQYLAYAAALVTAPPWFNEGHAELFERSHFDSRGALVFDRDPETVRYVRDAAEDIAGMLPDLMRMDYPEYYSGTDGDRAVKYGIGWSIAYFLEVGAPKVRFRPFDSLRADCVEALVSTRSAAAAHSAVFDEDTTARFVAAWLDFWKKQ